MLPLNHSLESSTIDREQVLNWLADNVPPSRIKHILAVEQMAIDLATYYQVDKQKAALAGLLHDLAKYFKPRKLLEIAQIAGLEIDPVSAATPHLLHADVSAIVARDTFKVTDNDVLNAIVNHTLGQPGMNELSCIVFLADTLEPGRGNTPELEHLRKICYQNLDKALFQTCDYSLKFLLETHCLIHPRTIATRNWFLQKAQKKQLATPPTTA
ncbi:bis(5'-nucleosyl)-tetraphosphatase (symmetrical) YqeK [Synechocystis sp. PCC 7509]|uniref:bis(5'-nucleosyl)-tetraphosphatase (symmetrical) YqeK n=1 Tax=Synechocystis sp. PCC 7509 TaxID=927677 RepID=UPI0002AC9D3D|nr:bis(5'-nucleosyl)-tetraphosphatase (symmetrical) YqeK [Synechocystis sp. PCC 7509]